MAHPSASKSYNDYHATLNKILSKEQKGFEIDITGWDSSIIGTKEMEAFNEAHKCLKSQLKVDQIRKLLKSQYDSELLG